MSCLAGPAGADPIGSKGRTIMANQARLVGGIDSHKDTIHVAVITEVGVALEDREFPTTTTGYREATGWLTAHGSLAAVRVEGTSSYGAGIAAALLDCGVRVVEVNGTRPAERRKQGKSDQLDAYRAARAVVAGEATTGPERASIEPLRALMIARRSAVKAEQAAWRQIGALLVNAPAQLRDQYRDLPEVKLLATLANTRPSRRNAIADADHADTLFALHTLARRHHDLTAEITLIQERMQARATAANLAPVAIKASAPSSVRRC
jgi:transposase